MFIHLGQDIVVDKNDIVGIFDMENTSVSKITKEFLVKRSKAKEIVSISSDLPKSFVVVKKDCDVTVYTTPLSTATLLKRS